MKKQLRANKLHTKIEKIRSLVGDQIARVNGGGSLPINKDDNDNGNDDTGCPCHTLVP